MSQRMVLRAAAKAPASSLAELIRFTVRFGLIHYQAISHMSGDTHEKPT